jgi:transcription antitermination factor NusG
LEIKKWFIAETTANREAIVAFALKCFEIETYLPLSLQSERVIVHKRQKEIACRASIPRLVFFKAETRSVHDVLKIKDVMDVIRMATGQPATISDREMTMIKSHHSSLLFEAVDAHNKGKTIRSQKQKDRTVKMDKDSLMEWLQKNMGIQDLEAEKIAVQDWDER